MDHGTQDQQTMTTLWTTDDLGWLEEAVSDASQIAQWRVKLSVGRGGFASLFVPLLEAIAASWFARTGETPPSFSPSLNLQSLHEEKKDDRMHDQAGKIASTIRDREETRWLRQSLEIHASISSLDATLSEELGRQGSHRILSAIATFDVSHFEDEQDRDCIMDLQDLVCEIAARAGGSFPIKVAPMSLDDIRGRLPLTFQLDRAGTILIHQVNQRQSAQQDVGFVMWPSAVALARWIDRNSEVVAGKTILELGAGCGLVGLVAAKLQREQKGSVILTDFNETVLENARRNIRLNNVDRIATANGLDFYQQHGSASEWTDTEGARHSPVDVVFGADIICQPDDAVAAAKSIQDALVSGGRAIVICADATHRFGVDRFESECKRIGLSVLVHEDIADLYDERLHNEGMDLTTGYVNGMTLQFFDISKLR